MYNSLQPRLVRLAQVLFQHLATDAILGRLDAVVQTGPACM